MDEQTNNKKDTLFCAKISFEEFVYCIIILQRVTTCKRYYFNIRMIIK